MAHSFIGRSDNFLEVWINFIKDYDTVRLWDSVLGVSTIIILLLLRVILFTFLFI